MFFNRKNQKLNEDEEFNLIKENYRKQLKQSRRNRIKRATLSVVLFFGLIGGYKSLLENNNDTNVVSTEKYIEVSEFSKDYISRYFSTEKVDLNFIKSSTSPNIQILTYTGEEDIFISPTVNNVAIEKLVIKKDAFEVLVTYNIDGEASSSLLYVKDGDNFTVTNSVRIDTYSLGVPFEINTSLDDGEVVDASDKATATSLIGKFLLAVNEDARIVESATKDTNETKLFYQKDFSILTGTTFDIESINVQNCVLMDNKVTKCNFSVKQIYKEYTIEQLYTIELNLNENKVVNIK